MTSRKDLLSLLLVIIVSVGIYWIWFTRWNIYTWGDWGYFYNETAKEYFQVPQVWSSSGLGELDIGLPMYPLLGFLLGSISHWLPAYQGLHLIYLLPSVLICAVGGYALSRYIHNSNIAGIVGSAVYVFNTYFLIIRGGHLPLLNSFALAPLIILFFLVALKTSKLIHFFIAGLLLSLSAAYEIRGTYLIFGMLVGLVIFYLPITPKKTLTKSLISLAVFVFLNLYWILGLFLSGGAGGSSLFHRELYGEGYTHLVRSSVLQLHQWSPEGKIGPGIQPTSWYLWAIPLLGFLEFYLSKNKRIMVFFGLVTLVGIFFSKMTNQPFGQIYKLMFTYFPGFTIFREPSKFFFLTSIGYSILLSGIVNRVWNKFSKTVIQKFLRISLFVFVTGLFLINSKNVITGDLGELLKPRELPADYLVLKDFYKQQSEFFRTFYLPYISRWGYFEFNKPTINGLPLTQGEWYSLNSYSETGLGFSYLKEVTNIFTKPFSNKLLDMSSIKYVVIPVQDTKNNDDLFAIYGSRNEYINFIKNLNYLKRVNINTSELEIYENSNYLPRFYSTDEVDSIYSASISAKPVTYSRVSSTLYYIDLSTKDKGKYLQFTDQYHPGWKLISGKRNLIELLIFNKDSLPSELHVKNTANLNSFFIPSSDNLNDSYTLFFLPQLYLLIGLGVGLSGFLITSIIIIFQKYIFK